jgi:histidine triad (HIT) family protein
MKILLLLLCIAVPLLANETKVCVFCRIVAGQAPAAVVYRDAAVVAFMDRAPFNPGHVLIVPVAHADNFLETPPETLAAMMRAAQRLGRAIQRTDLRCEGFRVGMNTGEAAGQTVFHVHLHLIPRFTGDGKQHSEDNIVPLAQLEATAAKIRAALAAGD